MGKNACPGKKVSMINSLHALLHRPEKGWDPVPLAHAEKYAAAEWEQVDMALLDKLEKWLNGFQGKRVLDLGGGPGHYSVAFAQRGAHVTWHDVSRNYWQIAQKQAASAKVQINFSLGYLEEAAKFIDRPFDVVFNRLCWYYCKNDRAFARLFYQLLKPGGAGYIDTHIARRDAQYGKRKFVYFLNDRLSWKIGHPFPPKGRIIELLQKYPLASIIIDDASALNDRVFFVKSKAAAA